MNHKWTAAILSLPCWSCPGGCKRSTEHKEAAHEPPHEDQRKTRGAGASARTVRSIRRCSTTCASRPPRRKRARPGRDDALGDLGVNEDHYAEVGSPISARVVEVIASAGTPCVPDKRSPASRASTRRVRAELVTASARQARRRCAPAKRKLAADGIGAGDVRSPRRRLCLGPAGATRATLSARDRP
jgi:hypothetical protein